MKYGYRIVIHKLIPMQDLPNIYRFCSDKIDDFNKYGWKCRRQSHAFYRRGIFGLLINHTDYPKGVITPYGKYKYVFRRMVKNRRIFGVIPIVFLIHKDNPKQSIDMNRCICGEHLGGTPVKIIGGFNEEDYKIYYETGDIKG